MISCVYVETAVRNHPRTVQLLKRLHKLPLIEIEHYGEVFNPLSQNFRSMLNMEPAARVVTAFSFSDQVSHSKLENGVPSIAKRIDAMHRLIKAGWLVGLRFDPVVYHQHYQNAFVDLLEQVFAKIDAQKLHSVSLGSFRLTRDHFRRISRLYPEEPLFAQNMDLNNGIISYPLDREQEMIEFCEAQLMSYIPAQSYHPCEWHG